MSPPEHTSGFDDVSSPPQAKVTFHNTPSVSRKIRSFIDTLAAGVVWTGGIATILSIMGIFVYLAIEVIPLFVSPTETAQNKFPLPVESSVVPQVRNVGIDEYQEVAYVIEGEQVKFFSLPEGLPIPIQEGSRDEGDHIKQVARSMGRGHDFAFGTQDGRIIPFDIAFRSKFQNQKRTIIPSFDMGEALDIDPTHSTLQHLAYQVTENGLITASINENGQLWVTKFEEGEGLMDDGELVATQNLLAPKVTGPVSAMILDTQGERLVLGTLDGQLIHWDLRDVDSPRLMERKHITESGDGITAITFLIGDRTLIVGTQSGEVSSWVPMREDGNPRSLTFKQARSFVSHRGAVMAISPSRRDKGFLTADDTGNVFLHHSTSGQTLLQMNVSDHPVLALMFSPKADGMIALDDQGYVHTLEFDNAHPEITVQTLFGPVLYEGYDQPEHIWQSSSGSDDFEPKFGLIPLIFGTLKGTIYAMILAVPLAVMGAIYTGMFMPARLRGIVKPIIEIMAALPSVVLGFLAGLWLAPLLEKIFPAMVSMLIMAPLMVVAVCLAWHFFPISSKVRNRTGIDLILLGVVIVLTVIGCLAANHQIESLLFNSDYKGWLQSHFGLQYDQRNALVISFAMGFAVIPIIFSISEDSISNVPKHLIAGSLAMGATQWQTLTQLVLVSASPGIFSALMIGFGRAVGETMIVLMATGNTPILDWSVFNGFRTLSANIAVEMPEAPHGGTLYRILFLSGLILFAFTFFINTIAEIIRQRLRQKYSQF